MTRSSTAEITARPASTASCDDLALEQVRIDAELAGLIAEMGAETTSPARRDGITGAITGLLASIESLRFERARRAAAQAGEPARWRDHLAPI